MKNIFTIKMKGIKYKVIFKMTGEFGDIYVYTMLTDGKNPW